MNSPVAWALVVHIVGFVFWIGGLQVATQVLAMHTREASVESRAALARLERKLLNGIAHPGAVLTVVAGITVLILQPSYLTQGWLHVKLLLVVGLIALDAFISVRARAFQQGRIELQRRECKMLHAGVSLLFLAIVVLVMIKPF